MANNLTKISFNMIRKGVTALDHVAELTSDTRTDCLNRSVQLYDLLMTAQAKGDALMLVHADGSVETLRIL